MRKLFSLIVDQQHHPRAFWLVDGVLSGVCCEVYRFVAVPQQSACASTLGCSVCAGPCRACGVCAIWNCRPVFPSVITPVTGCHHRKSLCLSFTVSMLDTPHHVPHGADSWGVGSSDHRLALVRHDLSLCRTQLPHQSYTNIV